MKENKEGMVKQKIAAIILGVGLISLLTGVTFAFFNYTKTGVVNNIGTGRIYFNSTQNGQLNMTNVFPMTSEEIANTELDSMSISIVGDTTYANGEEYLISFVDVNNTVNGKKIPINYIATYEPATDKVIGTENSDYWNERENKNANIYLLNETGTINENKQLLVGFIKNDNDGINGTLTIKAYIDAEKVAITDTPEENASWINGREVFSTTEWSSLKTNPISFKVRAESNEGIWVEQEATPASCFITKAVNLSMNDLTNTNNASALSYCIQYFNNANWATGETSELFCQGTGTLNGETFQEFLDNGYFSVKETNDLLEHNVIDNLSAKVSILKYKSIEYLYDLNDLSNPSNEIALNKCVNYYMEYFDTSDEAYVKSFCQGTGTGTYSNKTFQESLNTHTFWNDETLNYLVDNEIVTKKVINPSCATDVVIPKKLPIIARYSLNDLSNTANSEALNKCANYVSNLSYAIDSGDSFESFCKGTATVTMYSTSGEVGYNFQDFLDNNIFNTRDIYYFIENGIINANYSSKDYNVSIIEDLSFSTHVGNEGYYGILTSVVIPDGVIKIGNDAFNSNKLKKLVMPDTVTEIGDLAFYGNNLTNISLSNSLNKIGKETFSSNKLMSVTIPDSVTKIGQYAFSYNNLTNVTIGNGITEIGNSAFQKDDYSNPNLSSITIDKACSVIKNMTDYAWIGYGYDAGTTIYGSGGEVCDSW